MTPHLDNQGFLKEQDGAAAGNSEPEFVVFADRKALIERTFLLEDSAVSGLNSD